MASVSPACCALARQRRKAASPASPAKRATPANITSCIFIFCYGGPSHLDTFDLKPDTPAEIRGEFRAIRTSVPGLHICEHLPRLSRVMHRVAIIRSMHHANGAHDPASIETLTGRPPPGGDRELFAPTPQFYPNHGSALAYARRAMRLELGHAALPWVFRNVHDVPCQGGGFLGPVYDPFLITGPPRRVDYRAEMLQLVDGLDMPRIRQRMNLVGRLESGSASPMALTQSMAHLDTYTQKALDLLDSQRIRRALDIGREDRRVRDRYGLGPLLPPQGQGTGAGNAHGRNLRGQNFLLARRLVEAGVPFINIYDYKQQGQNWDAHNDNFGQHRDHLLPALDGALSALIEDLQERGLLDTTLVVVTGEFGRTPKINGKAGRDHWPDCHSVLLAGGGVAGGSVHGASDSFGAYPARDGVTPGDLTATIFWRFGIDSRTKIYDQLGRPYPLADGEPIRELFV